MTARLAGTSALEYLNRPSSRSLQVVFMDIMMPGLTGIQVLEGLACKPYHCPIIATTGSVEDEAVAEMKYE